MKLVVSSFINVKESLALFDIDLKSATYKKLATDDLNSPCFVIYAENYIITYTKEPLYLLCYKISENKFEKIDSFKMQGISMTHLVYSPKNKKLFGASYEDGALMSIDFKDGKFSNYKYLKEGKENEDSKCHCVTLNEEQTKLIVTNIALDKLFVYDMNLNLIETFDIEKGKGPRHTITKGKLLYVMTEYSNEVIIIDTESKKILQTIPTLQKKVESTGSTLLFNKNGNILFAGNRGEETIACFKVLENGLVEFKEDFDCGGKHPRHIILSKDGEYLIICNKNTNSVTFMNASDGKILLNIPFTEPSGICEVN